jgi:hypothetical protein
MLKDKSCKDALRELAKRYAGGEELTEEAFFEKYEKRAADLYGKCVAHDLSSCKFAFIPKTAGRDVASLFQYMEENHWDYIRDGKLFYGVDPYTAWDSSWLVCLFEYTTPQGSLALPKPGESYDDKRVEQDGSMYEWFFIEGENPFNKKPMSVNCLRKTEL